MKLPYENLVGECRAEIARQKLSQNEICKKLGISKANLSKKLSGDRAFKTTELITLSQILGMPLSQLFLRAEAVTRAETKFAA